MEYEIIILATAARDLEDLDPATRKRVIARLRWLAENADQVSHHRLQGMPDALSGLLRFRAGDYRILYWKFDETPRRLEVYRVQHRREVYRAL